MAGYEFCGDVPFRNVYLTGIVRDKLGRKMSKSLGNSPDPIVLMEQYGADGVRVGMLLCSSAGNDILFDESQVEQGRNFSNKIWNAYRLIKGWEVSDSAELAPEASIAMEWFDSMISNAIEITDDHFDKFRISDAIMHLYKLFWDDFCSWYLEVVKPPFGSPVNKCCYEATVGFFDKLLRLLHPFMPFITEELWQNIENRKEGESIMVSDMPKAEPYSQKFLDEFTRVKDVVVNVRNIRQSKGISPKEPLSLYVKSDFPESMASVIKKMANAELKSVAGEGVISSGISFMVGTVEFCVPIDGMVDSAEELKKIDAELQHLEAFLKSVNAKLSNEKFMANAPAQVLELEKKKKSDAETKIEKLNILKKQFTP